MSKEQAYGLLMSLRNHIVLLATDNHEAAWEMKLQAETEDERIAAAKTEGIAEGLRIAAMIVDEMRRGLGGDSDDRGHRESTQQTGSDPKTSARD